MKKIIIILLPVLVATAVGLYFRPSFLLVGQLDWWNVLTKGFFVGSFNALFSQAYIDESFWYVMRYFAGGLIVGLITAMSTSSKK